MLVGNVGSLKLEKRCRLEGRMAECRQVGSEIEEHGGIQEDGLVGGRGTLGQQVDGLGRVAGRGRDGERGQVEEWECVGECGRVG